MKILRVAALVALLLFFVIGVALLASRPAPLPDGLESTARLAAGPWPISTSRHTWIDTTRDTDANGDFPGADERSFDVRVWSPVESPEPAPLIIYSHGFMSNADGGTYLGEHLASYGYVVVSASYPLTHFMAPGGPNADDVINQPRDVSFLIDQALERMGRRDGIRVRIDPTRIGVVGLSLGGLTTTLVAYHPEMGDSRIRAAVSIAGPSVLFGPHYFEQADIPFLMVAGTHDSMINFEENALPVPDLVRRGGLVAIEGGTHAAFSHLASGVMRLLGNPDKLGCRSLLANLELQSGENPFPDLGGPEVGMVDARGAKLPCETRFDEGIAAGRQQWFTTLATRAFLESHFARDPNDRAQHARYLSQTMADEIDEVSFAPARRAS